MFKVVHFNIICGNNKKEYKLFNYGNVQHVLIQKVVLGILNQNVGTSLVVQ